MQPRHLLLLFASSAILIAGCSSVPASGAGGFGGTSSATSGTGGGSTGTTGTSGTTTTTSGGGAGTTTTTSSNGTGTSSSGSTAYSCSVQSAITAYCILYQGLTAAEMSADMATCTAGGGTSGTSCPSAAALGTCTQTADGVTSVTTYYSGTATTAAEAQATCMSGFGTWMAS
jgi:hypothetical protein